jgi:hypothetical protein
MGTGIKGISSGHALLALLAALVGPVDAPAEEPKKAQSITAADIVESQGWLYEPSTKVEGRKSFLKVWVGQKHPNNATFSSYDGIFLNFGSYDEAFEFYALKCGKEKGFKLAINKKALPFLGVVAGEF